MDERSKDDIKSDIDIDSAQKRRKYLGEKDRVEFSVRNAIGNFLVQVILVLDAGEATRRAIPAIKLAL